MLTLRALASATNSMSVTIRSWFSILEIPGLSIRTPPSSKRAESSACVRLGFAPALAKRTLGPTRFFFRVL